MEEKKDIQYKESLPRGASIVIDTSLTGLKGGRVLNLSDMLNGSQAFQEYAKQSKAVWVKGVKVYVIPDQAFVCDSDTYWLAQSKVGDDAKLYNTQCQVGAKHYSFYINPYCKKCFFPDLPLLNNNFKIWALNDSARYILNVEFNCHFYN